MRITEYTHFIPWVFIGSLIGTLLIVPMMPKIVDALYYKNKYNNEAVNFYKTYMDKCYTIKVTMPPEESQLYLNNIDDAKYPLSEVFDTTYNSSIFFYNPSADYTSFYCKEYKKYMNIIAFMNVNGSYVEKELYLTVNRDDMNNPEYGTKDNPVPVLKAVGVSEPIWFSGKDTDSVFMDNFYRNNVINYLKYKMPKEEFKRRFKSKG